MLAYVLDLLEKGIIDEITYLFIDRWVPRWLHCCLCKRSWCCRYYCHHASCHELMIVEYSYIENWNYGMFFRNLAPVHRHTVLINSRFVLRRVSKYNLKRVYNAVFIVGVRVSIGLRIVDIFLLIGSVSNISTGDGSGTCSCSLPSLSVYRILIFTFS